MRPPNQTASLPRRIIRSAFALLLPVFRSVARGSIARGFIACTSILAFGAMLVFGAAPLAAQTSPQDRYAQIFEHQRGHDTAQWSTIAEHLPDRLRASPDTLEAQGDTLRARRFFEDANDYYNYALQNGGEPARLLNKIGMTELESRDIASARLFFKRVVSIDRNDAQGWNNLAVVEHISGRLPSAIANYERAARLDPARAIYHANLAIAYLDHAEIYAGRREISSALHLDPAIFETEGQSAGAAARVVSSGGRVRLLVELARLYARAKDEPRMLHALAAAGEAGVDIRAEMRHDRVLSTYRDDPRVIVLYRNSQLLRMIGEPDPTQPDNHSGAAETGEDAPLAAEALNRPDLFPPERSC